MALILSAFQFLAVLIKSYKPSTQKNSPDLNFSCDFRDLVDVHPTLKPTGPSRGLQAPGYELQPRFSKSSLGRNM